METINPVPRRHFTVQSQRLIEAKEWMQRVNGPHQLKVNSQPGLYFKHRGTEVGHVATGYIKYSTEVTISAQNLKQSYCIGIPLVGDQLISCEQQQFVSTPEVGVILSPDMSFSMTLSEDCEKRMLRISRFALEECVRQLIRRPLDQPLIFDPMMDFSGPVKAWFELFQQLQPLLDCPQSLIGQQKLWQPLEQALIKSLVYMQSHNYSEQLLDTQERPKYLLVLENEMEKSLMERLTLSDLENIAGVSRERLYRDFHKHYQMSPMAYFKTLKLDEVRKRLLQARPSEKISSIALDYGFSQLGRFSQDYKARYQELPSQTLARVLN